MFKKLCLLLDMPEVQGGIGIRVCTTLCKRSEVKKPLPYTSGWMIDNNGMTNTFNPTFTITNRIASGLTLIERARGFVEAATLSEDWLQEMGRRALVSEAHYTTHIEGTQLTLDQSEQLLEGKSVPEADPEDTRELLNYRTAFEFVSEYLASGDPITESLIREIHKRLVEGVRGGSASPGEYRKTQNYVVNSLTDEIIYTPPHPVMYPP